jgi:hypothetical protein
MSPLRNTREGKAVVREVEVEAEAEAEAERVPDAPEPEIADPTVGAETAQATASRYLPNCVRLFAGVAFGKGSRAKLHSRVIAASHLVKIAGGMAEEVPDPD